MKRLLLAAIALIITVSASAQYATSTPVQIEARGSRIFSNGEKLTVDQAEVLFSDFGGQDRGEEYLSNRAGYKTGVGLSVGGAAVFAVGVPASYLTLFLYGLSTISGNEAPTGIKVATGGV